MKIRQLSVSYLPQQDRILLRLGDEADQETRVWLTRRVMAGLWPRLVQLRTELVLRGEAADSAVQGARDGLRDMLVDFRKEQALQEADLSTPYRPRAPSPLLGPQPLLATEARASADEAGRLQLSFVERLGGEQRPRQFGMTVGIRMLHALHHLLAQALDKAGWGLPSEGAGSAAPQGRHTSPTPLLN